MQDNIISSVYSLTGTHTRTHTHTHARTHTHTHTHTQTHTHTHTVCCYSYRSFFVRRRPFFLSDGMNISSQSALPSPFPEGVMSSLLSITFPYHSNRLTSLSFSPFISLSLSLPFSLSFSFSL